MLDRCKLDPDEERNSRKEPLTEKEAQELIARASRILVAKGRKIQEVPPSEATPEDLKGPTGNFRAPILVLGDTLLVGFHGETLEELVQ